MTPRLISGKKWLATAAAMLLVAAPVFGENKARVTQEDGRTAQMVANMVSSRHINHPSIDDSLSEKLLDSFIKVWDPQKLYFLQSDIDEFNKQRTSLDDQILAGDVNFANTVFERFRLRMNERQASIGKWIDASHDFTVDESLIRDPKDLPWAKTESEIDERWRKRIKYDLLLLKMDKSEDEKDAEPKTDDERLADARKRLHKRYHTNRIFLEQTEPHEILELYLSSMTHSLDPHSSYMSPKTVEDFRIVMGLKLEGIGARLKYEEGYTVVEDVIEGGAAFADGRLKKGDKIIGVSADGVSEFVDVVEMKLTKVVDMIRGARGTNVKLQVLKEAGGIEEYALVRTTVQIDDDEVKGEVIESSEWIDGRKARVGILNIPSFYRDFNQASIGGEFTSTSRDVKKVLQEFNEQDVDILVVDLRWNGGGALLEAIEVSGLFIPRGPVVQVKEPENAVTPYDDEDPEMQWKKPMVVVCNRFSASASEIFAGAIKDYRRGIVIGDTTTHGKGTVQNVVDVAGRLSLFSRDRGALKLTISKFYRVNGDSTQTKGVTSDIVLPSLLNHRDIGEDSLDNALAFDRITRAQYVPFSSLVNDAIIAQLAKNSEARVSGDKDFARIQRLITRYLERKNDKTVSLNENTLKAEEEELKQEQQEEEEAIKKASGAAEKDDIFPRGFYNKELLNITTDYLEILQGTQTVKS
ncbi:MAG: carboxy terminal-processing peptidase [Planctomycetaceae bacterium]|nr:carboxy terminal-processing peptidase [Planctomycetaceae bacterium]